MLHLINLFIMLLTSSSYFFYHLNMKRCQHDNVVVLYRYTLCPKTYCWVETVYFLRKQLLWTVIKRVQHKQSQSGSNDCYLMRKDRVEGNFKRSGLVIKWITEVKRVNAVSYYLTSQELAQKQGQQFFIRTLKIFRLIQKLS